MRLLRGNVPNLLHEYDYKFELGMASILRDGDDVLFISTGLMTMRVLEVAKQLEKVKIDFAVLHVSTIKPLDVATIRQTANQSERLVVSAENHTINGGLGEAIAADLLRNGIHPIFRQIALPDEFLEAGALFTLHDRYGLSINSVNSKIKSWLEN